MYGAIASNKRKTVIILAVFFALVGGLAVLLGNMYQDYSITTFVLIFAIIYALWGYFGASKLALAMNGAKQISKVDDPRLWRTVENLTITTGMLMPKVYVIDDKGMNAFATGRDPAHAVVAVTSGLLEQLTDTELEGVLAHELGHIKNYDIRVSMIAFALVTVVSLLCDFFLRVSFWGNKDNNAGDRAGAVLAIIGLVAIIISPIVALMLQLAISRKREYLADATGALTTRYPEGLASALEKIKKSGSSLRRQNTSTAHLFIANPLKGKSIGGLFSTHPPIDERIKLLRSMDSKV